MSRSITIRGGDIALALSLPDAGQPEILSCGRKAVFAGASLGVERSSRINGMDIAPPSAVLCPTGGMGTFGWPAIAGHRQGHDFTLQFGGWEVEQSGKDVILHGTDTVSLITMSIKISPSDHGVIGMSTRLTNNGAGVFSLDRCMAGGFLIGGGTAKMTGYTGMWGREFQTRTFELNHATYLQESRRGRTSHDRFPLIFANADGQDLGFHLGWSGNHIMAIDPLDDGRRLVHMGELFEPGEIQLEHGQSYESPVAYMSASTEAFHAFVRHELIPWPGGKMRPRPVTLNTWEGNYFDHRMDSLQAQADAAAHLGIERFVLDDGWFGKRDDDTTSLGDWTIDTRKYPKGLSELIDHVVGLGMEFGIWYEPEMVNPDSELYRAHPDWVLQVEGRPLLLSRNQLVLDLSRPEVSDYLFDQMSAVLSTEKIAYIKWDMNRDLTHVGGRDGRAMTSRQTRAVYTLMARIGAAFPALEIESCASGGGRIDYGVLAHTHRVWTSDCTDALERLEIQRGASSFMPVELLGSHVSASPNHQTHRQLTLAFRAIVALGYHFGVELNPLTLSAAETAELKHFIGVHKALRPLLHAAGSQFRLEPRDGRNVWGAESESKVVAFVAQGPQMVGEQPAPLELPLKQAGSGTWRIVAVHPEKPDFIRISESQKRLLAGEITFGLGAMTAIGLTLPMLRPESGMILEIERVGGEDDHG